MELKMSEKTKGKFGEEIVKKFINDLTTGQSFLQEPNEKPDYVLNHASGEVFRGINMIIVNQAMKDNNKVSGQALTVSQRDQLGLYSEKGSHAICQAIYDKFDAWYRKNDPEVIDGKAEAGTHKKDENGNYVQDKTFPYIFAADDLVKTKFEPTRDETGNVMHYEKDVYYEDVTHTKDGSYILPDGTTYEYKKGDPVIEHHKGTVIGKNVPTNEHVVSNKKANLPPLYDEEMAPIPARKDDSVKEMFVEKLAKAFRGKLQGNYEGANFSKKEIALIANEYTGHLNQFINAVKSADNRANMTAKDYKKMMENIQAKQNSNAETNQEETKNTAKKGRK